MLFFGVRVVEDVFLVAFTGGALVIGMMPYRNNKSDNSYNESCYRYDD
jgi:hypothetical protein